MKFTEKKQFYFLLSFIEGGSVMATELIGAKMLAPYFGSSLYVWASVLAITLGGLACGYFMGGVLSYKSGSRNSLFYVMLAAAIFTMLMPYSSKIVLWTIGSHSLIPSVILSAGIILMPPVFLMGMVSPLIIKLTTDNVEKSGKSAGVIYAVSTVGGILATFGFGFWIIPHFGLTLPAIVTGIALGFLPALELVKSKKIKSVLFFLLLICWSFYNATQSSFGSAIKIQYNTEGLLGQLMVLDYPRYKDSVISGKSRWLFVNRISQTMYDSLADETQNEEKYFTYVYRINDMLDSIPADSKILLLGLGGGVVANTIHARGFDIEVCELDERMKYVAQTYFNLDKSIPVTIDDARHFIKNCNKKYEVIIFDTFKGEEPPAHVFTKESLEETQQILSPDGIIIVNGMGYITGKEGKAMRSVYKTFEQAGYNVKIMPTSENPDERNLLFVAGKNKLPSLPFCLPKNTIDTQDAMVLTDEYPVLDILNAYAAMRWRKLAINSFNSDYNQKMLPVFE